MTHVSSTLTNLFYTATLSLMENPSIHTHHTYTVHIMVDCQNDPVTLMELS